MAKPKINKNQLDLDFSSENNLESNQQQHKGMGNKMTEKNNNNHEPEDLDVEGESIRTKKIDNYIPPVSPILEEINVLNSFFNQNIGKPVTVQEKINSGIKQENYPEISKSFELTFDFDLNSSTKSLHNRLRALAKPLGGHIKEPTIMEDTCSVTVVLPTTLEVATAFFENFLKNQFNNDVKMSGSIFMESYTLIASGSPENIQAIKADWISFSKVSNWGGFDGVSSPRELTIGKDFLSMTFNNPEDYIANSGSLGINGSNKNGVTYSTDIDFIIIKEGINYDPTRRITPD